MQRRNSKSHTASSSNPPRETAAIEISANGNRRSLEALYLDMCELAKKNGLKVEYQLSRVKPEDSPA